MAGNNTTNIQELIRTELWEAQLEEILHENLMGFQALVREVDFPDGNQLTLPSIGTPVTRDWPEGTEVVFDTLDTGEVSITMGTPIVAANSITKVARQDTFYLQQLLAAIPTEQAQAIMERIETDVFGLAMSQFAGTDDQNLINGVAHRKVAGGTNETIQPQDFAFANYSLTKAKIPDMNRFAIVDPSVAYALETTTNLVNVSNNPRWEGLIESGISKNFRFIKNVFGFDVFVSNLLPEANETIDGLTTTAGVANIFSSMARPGLSPFTMAWRQRPEMETNIDFGTGDLQVRTDARLGAGVTRDENLVVILSDTDQVS